MRATNRIAAIFGDIFCLSFLGYRCMMESWRCREKRNSEGEKGKLARDPLVILHAIRFVFVSIRNCIHVRLFPPPVSTLIAVYYRIIVIIFKDFPDLIFYLKFYEKPNARFI